jgi:bloom syndrome protein
MADSKTILGMIDRDDNLTRDQKERQKASMHEVLRFCNNKTDCRRSQVLAFFNEVFDAANCHQGCDVCLGRDLNRFTVEDVTADAIQVLRMIQKFGAGDRITVINAVDCFRGMKGSGDKGLDRNELYGCGKAWERGEAERLVQTLLIEGGLAEFFTANMAGWNNAYLTVSKRLVSAHFSSVQKPNYISRARRR